MRRHSLLAVATTFVLAGCSAQHSTTPTAASTEAPTTEEQKILYALGAALANNLRDFDLSAEELKSVQAAFAKTSSGSEPKLNVESYMPKIQALQSQRREKFAALELEASNAYLAKAAAEAGAVKTESGLILQTLTAGTGPTPQGTDIVKVHYHGTFRDGQVFDSSVERGKPVEVPMNGIIQCWNEGLLKMKVGGKSRFVCPAELAYGNAGAPPKVKPNAALIFEVELLQIMKPQQHG